MSKLRARTQEISAEYWAVRDTQSERVAVAQLVLALARAEQSIAEHEQAETRLCGKLVGAHWRDGLDQSALAALDEFLDWAIARAEAQSASALPSGSETT